MRDMYSNILLVQSIAPAIHAATAEGAAVDIQGAASLGFSINTGAIAGDGAFSLKLQESADGTAWADVNEMFVKSNVPATLGADKVYKIGYSGWHRYVRPVLTKKSGTSIALGVVGVIGPFNRPGV